VRRDADPPAVEDPGRVGSYPGAVAGGGGFVWDAVLEYRVWCHPERGAPDVDDGNDYFYAFVSYAEAAEFSRVTPGAEDPLALIRQDEHLDEPSPGRYVHVTEPRLTEWPVEFLRRPRRTPSTIPDFLSPDAPANRLDILRGLAR
jgi:putative acetyltransferase